jgi:hypothetical protein
VAAAAKKSKTPGASKTRSRIQKATASGTETEIPPTENLPKKGPPGALSKKPGKQDPKVEPKEVAPAGFAVQKSTPPGFSSRKPKTHTNAPMKPGQLVTNAKKPPVAAPGIEAPKTPGSPGAGAPPSAQAPPSAEAPKAKPTFSPTAQGELDSFNSWGKRASKSQKTAATYRKFQDKAKETKTDQSEFPINADKEKGPPGEEDKGSEPDVGKPAKPESIVGRIANHALRALLGPKSRRIAQKFSRYMDKMNYPVGESTEIPMDATPRSPGSPGPSGDSPASDGRIQSEMVGNGVLPGSSGGGAGVDNVKEMDGDTSGVAFAGSPGEQFEPFSSNGGGTGAMEPGRPALVRETFEKLPNSAKFHSPDGGFSRIWMKHDKGWHFFQKNRKTQDWHHDSSASHSEMSDDEAGKELPRNHPSVKKAVKDNFMSESVFDDLYGESTVDLDQVYEIRTAYNSDGKDPTASEIMASPLPVSEEDEADE